jgi:FAD:protein FMN transferase
MGDWATTSFRALGTTAVIMAESPNLFSAAAQVERELADIDRTCSRFRADSDLSRLNGARGAWTEVDDLLAEATETALRAARLTGGVVDPTIGATLLHLGYDRDFFEVPASGPALGAGPPVPGWRLVDVRRDPSRIRIPDGALLDLGATAKALAADRAVARAVRATGAGVLVSLGGDVAAAGEPPVGGWAVGIADDHATTPQAGETISIAAGGLATSSTTVRRWERGGSAVHHIVDPRSGLPAPEVWRTVSVSAGTCVDANTASTAAIILGEQAPGWLSERRLPARLVRANGEVVRVAGWPERRQVA